MHLKQNKLRVGYSPLSEIIYAGHVGKEGRTWLSDQTDVTSDVVASIIEKVGVGKELVVTCRESGQHYKIKIEVI